MLNKLLLSSISFLGIAGAAGGISYHFLKSDTQTPPSFVIATLTSKDTNSQDLYKDGVKNFKCQLTYPATHGESSDAEISAEDADCEVFLVKDESYQDSKLRSLQPPKSENKVDNSSKLDQTTVNANYYQISLKDSVLDKFEKSNYQNIQIELVLDSGSDERPHATFNSLFRFKDANIQGIAKYIVVQVSDKVPSEETGSTEHKSFSLDDTQGYKLFALSNNGSESIKSSSEFKNEYFAHMNAPTDELAFSAINKNKFYIFMSPDNKPFQLDEIIGKSFDLKCSEANCNNSFKVTAVSFLTINKIS